MTVSSGDDKRQWDATGVHQGGRLVPILPPDRGVGTTDLARLRDEVGTALGPDMGFELRFVDNIPLTQTGKHRVTVCNVR